VPRNQQDRLRTKLEQLVQDAGITYKALGRELGLTEDAVLAWRRKNSQSRPSVDTCVSLGVLESSYTQKPQEVACKEWLSLCGRELAPEEMAERLRRRSPANEKFFQQIQRALVPLLGKHLVEGDLLPLAIARLSQDYSRRRLDEWLRDSPGGTASFHWDGVEEMLKVLEEGSLDKHAARILHPPLELTAKWTNTSPIDLLGFVTLPCGLNNGSDSEAMALRFQKAYATMVERLSNRNPPIENPKGRFRFYATSMFPLDSLGRWIYSGAKAASVRGTIIAEPDEDLVHTAKNVELGTGPDEDDVQAWTEPAVEMGRTQVETFLKSHKIEIKRGKLIPIEADHHSKGWKRLSPEPVS
jgi:hypothetical protein